MSLADTIIYGDKNAVMVALQNGADPNELDEYGFRPLIEAAIADKTEIAALLLQYGAFVDQEDSTGRTALHWAVENSNVNLCRLLLEHHANPNHYTTASQPVLVTPLLRNHTVLKKLLYESNANLNFALDYINTKLIGHRFELRGQVDIVTPDGRFIELDFEGFFLEFTLDIILQSLRRYCNNFAARHLRKYFKYIKYLIEAFQTAAHLIKYQQYRVNLNQHDEEIHQFLGQDLLILPVAHRGHAITFVRFGNLFAKCDRGENSFREGSINIGRVQNVSALNEQFFKALMYVKQAPGFIATGYKERLDLKPITRLPLAAQVTGNCSWANVEAAIPTILFLLMAQEGEGTREALRANIDEALAIYQAWCEWDRDRALQNCLQSYSEADRKRKASNAAILGAILFQCCHHMGEKDVERAEKILPILSQSEYRYILESYINTYWRQKKTLPGRHLIQLLDFCGLSWY